jgi:hypothetical protein
MRGEVLTTQIIDILRNQDIKVAVNTEGKNSDSYKIEWYEVDTKGVKDQLLSFEGNKITAEQLSQGQFEGSDLYCIVINNFNGKDIPGPKSRIFDIKKSGPEEK